MGNPVFKEKLQDKKLSFLRQVIRRSHLSSNRSRNPSHHPLRVLLEDPLESATADLDSRSDLNSQTGLNDLDDLESILLDNINPGINNMSVDHVDESPEEARLASLVDLQDVFSNYFPLNNVTRHERSSNTSLSFHRWHALRSTRPNSMRSTFVASRIPRPNVFNRPMERIYTAQSNNLPPESN